MAINKLHCGDNLTIMKDMPDESVDLIYLDPPYNTGRDFDAFEIILVRAEDIAEKGYFR